MKIETSAGGVVVRKKDRAWQVLLMKDMNGRWTFPKGLIEKTEKPESAAAREIAEEVGLAGLKLIKALRPIEYWYRRNGLIHKRVHYFLFEIKDNPKIKVQRQEGITSAHWFKFNRAQELVGYPRTNKPLLLACEKALVSYGY